jgi:hypothetical protein
VIPPATGRPTHAEQARRTFRTAARTSLGISLALSTVLAGCSLMAAASPSVAPRETQASSPAGATDGSTAEPPASFGPPPSPTAPDDTAPLSIDPSLLAFLPEAIDGRPVAPDPDEAAIALGNRSLDDLATAVNVAVGVDTATGNLVYALVVRLKPGALTDDAFRQWRDSFDEGACRTDGGIVGRAQAEIGGRNAYVTSCVAAYRSYHVLLDDQDVLVSAWSFGEGRFGEKLISGIRVPE